MSLSDKPQKKHSIAVNFRNRITLLLVLVLILMASVATAMIRGITGEASKNYARSYSIEAMNKFALSINRDLALVNKVSRSKAVTNWFADEDNIEKRNAAYNEMMDYAGILQSATLYFGINKSLNEYDIGSNAAIEDFVPFDVIDPAIAYNSWYFNCISSENEYTLNIDIDKTTGIRRLWINHKVEKDGNILGVFCSGIQFDDVLEELFGQYDSESVRGFIIDKNGVIQMDSQMDNDFITDAVISDGEPNIGIREMSPDPAFAAAIGRYLGNINAHFGPHMEPDVIKLSKGSYSYVSIAPISDTDWSVVTFFDSSSLFSVTRLLPLLIAILSAFVIYTIADSALMQQLVLIPLGKLTGSLANAVTDRGHIYGIDRDDEFGELARTIQNMRDSLSAYNAELLLATGERDRQERLLHAMNSMAAVLLAADDDEFERSLWDGMELMAQCMDVDRIHIWQNEMENGELYYIQRFEWLRSHDAVESSITSNTGFSYSKSIPEWEHKFLNNECVNGPLKKLSQVEQERLEPFGIKSILVIPVYLQDSFWGFVSFDDCHSERAFTEDEVSILRSGSLMLASAMNRNEADERTKLMLDSMPLCCNLWDKDFNNIDCNEEAVKLFELKTKQEYLDRFLELSPEYQPDGQLSSEKSLNFIKDAFANGRSVFEWLHQKLDGTPVPSEITLVRVKHGGGYIIIGYTRDLREYKKMMREIDHQDALLHTVNNVAAILLKSEADEFEGDLRRCMGMMANSVGADRVYIWKNRIKDGQLLCTQLYEWSEHAEPQQGKDFVTDVPLSESWEKELSGGQCINGMVGAMPPEVQNQLSPQGILSILVVPVFLQDTFWGFVGFDDCRRERVFTKDEESILHSGSLLIANALLRNEMTQDIRLAVSKMTAVISNYSGVIWSVNRDNVFTLFNGLYLKELGIKPNFLEGKSLDEARKANRYIDIIESVEKTIADGPQDWTSEIEGKIFHSHTTPICDESGNATGVVGSIDDITEMARLQKELETALEKAEAASRAKSNFLSNMSHEMRTPMNAIIGMTIIGKSASGLEKKDYAFRKIEGASNHLLGVINDILDMSKIEANKFELSSVEFSFEKMLQNVVNVISFRVDEKHQNLAVHLDRDIPQSLIGDDQRLAQIITNLISNAVKFTPEQGSIRLDTHLEKEEDGICTIQVEVKDTGIGISVEQQSRLFRSFEQAESSTSRKFGGTGLGLAISKHIVELMEGSIWVESVLGAGSTFAFTIKLRRGAKMSRSLLKPGVNWENVRVLAVDDEPEMCEYFAEIAEQLHISCDTAAKGEDALKLIGDKGCYDIYFVDWNMPGMNGIELSRSIKENCFDKSVIIMISATEWNVIEAEANAAGVDKFLPKPLFPSAIADCINNCMVSEELEAEEDVQPGTTETFNGYYMLLAEDVEINREIVLALLEPTMLHIDCAENGAEAVRMFLDAPERYDIIFMDVQMPEMDGLEATRQIRASGLARAKEVPIVAMTANVFREDIEKCLEAGMNDHLGKPFDLDDVINKIKKFVSEQKAHDALPLG